MEMSVSNRRAFEREHQRRIPTGHTGTVVKNVDGIFRSGPHHACVVVLLYMKYVRGVRARQSRTLPNFPT